MREERERIELVKGRELRRRRKGIERSERIVFLFLL